MGILEQMQQQLQEQAAEIRELTKRVEKLERSQAEYVGTSDAMRMTGLSRTALFDIRKAGKVEWKGEGSKVLYLRSSLEDLNESGKLRRKRK